MYHVVMVRWSSFLLALVVVLGIGIIPPHANAQTPAWRGFILIQFAPDFGEIDLSKSQKIKEALSGLCPVVGDYPPLLLQIMVSTAKDAVIAECRWYAKPERTEIARVLAFKFDASIVQAEAWITSLIYFGEDQAFEVSQSELRAYIQGKEEWQPPRPPRRQ